MGSAHVSHAMILDCVVVDVVKDQDDDEDWTNISFKFKNTYSNNKQVVIEANRKYKTASCHNSLKLEPLCFL